MSSLVVPRKRVSQQRKLPAENLKARVIGAVILGKQEAVYKGKKFLQKKIYLSFEFPENKTVYDEEKGEVPIIWGREYTYSARANSHLSKALKTLYPEDLKEGLEIDISKILWKPCFVQIEHEENKGKKYVNIDTVSKLPEGDDCPPRVHPMVFFDFDKNDPEIFHTLPQFLQEKIENWKANEIKEAESQEKAVAH